MWLASTYTSLPDTGRDGQGASQGQGSPINIVWTVAMFPVPVTLLTGPANAQSISSAAG